MIVVKEKETTIKKCGWCDNEVDEFYEKDMCEDCVALQDEWEDERKRDGYIEDSPTIDDTHSGYTAHLNEF